MPVGHSNTTRREPVDIGRLDILHDALAAEIRVTMIIRVNDDDVGFHRRAGSDRMT